MAASKEKRDKRFPLFAHDNPFRRVFLPPRRLTKPYVSKGQVAADIGCGPGFYTISLAEGVGPEGKVYAVDLDEKAIRALGKKAEKRGLRNIEARATTACNVGFIRDASVDFILANGLLCSVAPQHHESVVNEIKRILKPDGRAYLSVARGPWSYVDKPAWERILKGFRVERRAEGRFELADRWAVVSLRRRAD
jgi:ubiquinone/menaquinone biosynthesis C-methylase UbiE